MTIPQNFIDGAWVQTGDGATYEQRNPADLSEVTGVWPRASLEDVRAAIRAAERAYPVWSALTVHERGTYLKKALHFMEERVERIARVLTAENGKTLSEAKAEIASAIWEMGFQIEEGLRLNGEVVPSAKDGVLAYSVRRPLGVVSIIAPWNFPFNVPCRKITPALMAGNTCVFKPAQLTPGAGAEFVHVFEEAGLPHGVLNFVTGSGTVVGEELVTNPAIKAISFTGSTEVGMGIHVKAAGNLTRTQLEMGGKNPLVVLADADLAAAADSGVLAGYACAGQWCTSTSRVVVEEAVLDEFIGLLLERIKGIVVGPGTKPGVTMGPVCGEQQLASIMASIEKGRAEGARLLVGGSRLTHDAVAKGCFIEPTVFVDVSPEMHLAQEEIFGPVLSVMAVRNFDHAVDVANQVRFGLSSSIYTQDLQKALTFVERTDVGLTHVNLHTALKEPQLSFGGVKASGCGIPEAGATGIQFFTEHKVAYIKYR